MRRYRRAQPKPGLRRATPSVDWQASQPGNGPLHEMIQREKGSVQPKYAASPREEASIIQKHTGRLVNYLIEYPHLACSYESVRVADGFDYQIRYWVRHRINGEWLLAQHITPGFFQTPPSYIYRRMPTNVRQSYAERNKSLLYAIFSMAQSHLNWRLAARIDAQGKRLESKPSEALQMMRCGNEQSEKDQ